MVRHFTQEKVRTVRQSLDRPRNPLSAEPPKRRLFCLETKMELNTRLDNLRKTLERSGACYGTGETTNFFTNESEAVRVAQLICGACPMEAQAACLEYALSTNMEYGVWGGILFWDGQAFYRKRPPGRPRADEASLPVAASKEELWALVDKRSPMEKTA